MTLSPRMAISPTSPTGTSMPSRSTHRISHPGIATPMVPGFRSRSGMLNEATGEVSESPYPSRMTQPNLSSKERITSSGMAEPPDTQVRSDDASMPSDMGWLRMAAYIVGTP